MFATIQKIVSDALPAKIDFTLETPPDSQFGDLATNAALILAKQLGKNPRELATEIATKISASELVAKAEIAGPGFINIFLKDSVIWEAARKKIEPKEVSKNSPLIVVDFGGENIAKPMSVGHLRSNIIGQALCNIYKFIGWRIVGDNHLGDWGTQFGKLIVAWNKWAGDKKPEDATIQELNDLYVRFHEEAEKNPELEDEARVTFKNLEKAQLERLKVLIKISLHEAGEATEKEFLEKNPDIVLWLKFIYLSRKEFHKIHKRLEVPFPENNKQWNENNLEHYQEAGESWYLNRLSEEIEKLVREGVAKESEGALIATFEEEGWGPLLFRKSDGSTLYATRDLAAIDYRIEKFKPKKIVYAVGSDQELYFKQLFVVAKKCFGEGLKNTELVHAKFGMVRLPEGKMSTRKGRVIRLEDLLDEAEEKMKAVLAEKNCEIAGAEREKLIKDLAIGSVKFADLGHGRESDITFTWESALSFEGYAAPYLMYTHARACSISRKAGEFTLPQNIEKFSTPIERQLALKLDKFVGVVEEAAQSYHPHLIATYIYELAQDFNNFYHKSRVLNAESEELKRLRLGLVKQTAGIIKTGLGLLGIEAPEKM
ncbi:MAG: arginine--tRNA ligase [Patescibacteria group bacterium]